MWLGREPPGGWGPCCQSPGPWARKSSQALIKIPITSHVTTGPQDGLAWPGRLAAPDEASARRAQVTQSGHSDTSPLHPSPELKELLALWDGKHSNHGALGQRRRKKCITFQQNQTSSTSRPWVTKEPHEGLWAELPQASTGFKVLFSRPSTQGAGPPPLPAAGFCFTAKYWQYSSPVWDTALVL